MELIEKTKKIESTIMNIRSAICEAKIQNSLSRSLSSSLRDPLTTSVMPSVILMMGFCALSQSLEPFPESNSQVEKVWLPQAYGNLTQFHPPFVVTEKKMHQKPYSSEKKTELCI